MIAPRAALCVQTIKSCSFVRFITFIRDDDDDDDVLLPILMMMMMMILTVRKSFLGLDRAHRLYRCIDDLIFEDDEY